MPNFNTKNLQCQRDQFLIPSDIHYLNCAYLGPLSKKIQDLAKQCVTRQGMPWLWTPQDFFTEIAQIKTLAATLLNTSERHMAVVPSVSYAIATLIKNIHIKPHQNIIILDEQFPSNVYAWRNFQKQGVTLETVKRPVVQNNKGIAQRWNEDILEAINKDTAVISLPQVHWSDGTLFNLKEIAQKARTVGALVILDLTQSLGAMPFNQQEIQADVIVSAGYKHMMGPYGLSYAYFGDRFLDDGQPLEETWIARKNSEDFSRLVNYKDEYADGATRFDVGQKSNPIMLPMMICALQSILERDPSVIQNYCNDLTSNFVSELTSLGYEIEDESFRSSHVFGIRLPSHIDMDKLLELLEESNIKVSLRGNALRVSPNVYNDKTDIQALLSVLKTLV